ncbi:MULTISPECIES: gamma-carboxygeranoyl-CoA hydratase [Pseudomonas]|jgi:methylglutaconyl-CoA hydratase|uniref:Gamma-carboxygeranoyl-CoA hydratase n=1 Tax=Pseudomonas proteolytica TaxID=219574 RepID=A0AAW5AB10_9PSED|nr:MULTISPECIES: gamma-carboxygeranoyl-CoA hydratase [Pseudomonas]TDR46376.1 methylglutaconyl-CoA hydratase [Pseudomonas brenneri]KAA8698260.1 gamma-carboxygeranoyl-CoA hydratase [Pseudomonas proteolytica]MCF5060908.1 gamma-carboxygeranoyl-CoA hydratase [Pseudomonas proteolytica]MCF5104225.1 gamma-carboxygeranoyl-CoA hydratase [Pseudomonas proteolytica]MDF3162639.1 gamma-carboxygeranoyl-CoA hydratase [Pseudomonas proteolytica]
MSDFNTVELVNDPRGFATLWLSRQEKNNAFNAEMIRELIIALDQVQADATLRFLLIRGRGKHFSAGADLAWMQQSAELDYHTNLDDARELAELMYNLAKLKIPTLAVVQGAAYGGALGLISCCDMAIGADDAQFCLSEVRIGLAPAVISPFVVQAIGERAARRYALTAERFDGQQAQAIGLLAQSYPFDELNQQVEQWTANLLLNSPAAMRASKDLLREVGNGALTPALRRYCENAISRIRVSTEGQEGLRAFLQKRAPSWQSQEPRS